MTLSQPFGTSAGVMLVLKLQYNVL